MTICVWRGTPSQPSPADWGRGLPMSLRHRPFHPHPLDGLGAGSFGFAQDRRLDLSHRGRPLHDYLCVEGNPIPTFPSRLGKGSADEPQTPTFSPSPPRGTRGRLLRLRSGRRLDLSHRGRPLHDCPATAPRRPVSPSPQSSPIEGDLCMAICVWKGTPSQPSPADWGRGLPMSLRHRPFHPHPLDGLGAGSFGYAQDSV